VAFLPLVGFQTAIALGLAAVLRANKAVCVPIVWITNPATMWFIYGGCWKLGHWVTASAPPGDATAVLAKLERPSAVRFLDFAFWKEKFDLLVGLGVELWVGCLIIGVVLGGLSYVLAHRGVIGYRERRRRKLLKRDLFRSQLQRAKIARRSDPL
jgi:uncharacterized protein (DUF2062 family)